MGVNACTSAVFLLAGLIHEVDMDRLRNVTQIGFGFMHVKGNWGALGAQWVPERQY